MTTLVERDAARELDLLVVRRSVYDDLLALIAGRAPARIGRREAAESRLLVDRLLECWRILPSVPPVFFERPLKTLLQPEDFARLRRCWLAVSAFAKAQYVGSSRLIEAFERSGVAYSLLKGAAIARRAYARPYLRTSTDVDVGVSRSSLHWAEDLVRQVGYRPVQKNPANNRFQPAEPALRAAVEAQHYELCFFARRLQVTNLDGEILAAIREEPWAQRFWLDADGSEPWCYAFVDVHHALSLDIGLYDLLENARRVASGGSAARIPDDAWLTAHLIYKIYWEGAHHYGKGLYQFADLVRLVPLLDGSTCSRLIEILERENLVAAAHYTLRRVPAFGVELPAPLMSFVAETFEPPGQADPQRSDPFATSAASPMRLNDYGDMWARVWGQR